ncbi:long-chain-fatty-acid--CoA ligase [Halioxenophilus sp. WMMB6]|uniref:long-chain-fatty-acid--CoA ligase n=1 Tax=Halioxenophilus sp. WMMB6 TaxID=3073815 RepID=UPI00295EAE8D|nr:long-chain-fatty-acid--CoA ligase [Halioxenophilus sp. WMMB6]
MNSVADVIRAHAATQPDNSAMIFGSRVTSYARLDTYSNQVANGLLTLSAGAGERIAYLGKNSDHYYEIFFGAAKSQQVLVAINWRLAKQEVEYIINDSNVGILFADSEFQAQAESSLKNCDSLFRIIYVDQIDESGFEAWRDSQAVSDPCMPVSSQDPCIQMYTSGTTGMPKGVVLPHKSFFSQRQSERNVGQWADWHSDEVNLVAMPIFHIGGTGWGFIAFYHGATNIIHQTPDAVRIAHDIVAFQINRMFIVPSVLQQIVEYALDNALDCRSVKSVVYGASPISEQLLKSSLALFGCDFVQQYGMTETAGAVSYLPAEDHDVNGSKRMSSCGIPFPGIQIKICDQVGKTLTAGEVGEICIKSPAIMLGYWNNEAATKEAIVDGWYRSGDAGYLDEDGYLFLQDRIKDMIVSGAENIYPAEIEKAMLACEAIKDVAVIGVPDQRWGEAVKALVVLRENHTLDVAALQAFLRQRIAGYKIPKSIEAIDTIPRTASGKVMKHILREPYWKGYLRHVN